MANDVKALVIQGLETVADAAHKTVTVLKKLCNALFYFGIAEKCSDEFTASVRLISA